MNLFALKAAVAAFENVGESVAAMVDGLIDKLRGASGSQAEVDALVASLENERSEIIASVLRGTVADGEPIPPPPPPGDDTTAGGAADDGPATVGGGTDDDAVDPPADDAGGNGAGPA